MVGRTVLAVTLVAALVGSPQPVARATGVASAARAGDCALIAAQRVPGLRGTPDRVTLALATGYGRSAVRVTHCVRRDIGDRSSYEPAWVREGQVGRRGFARPGAKREGDGRSPSGVFALGPAFGGRDPGARVPYLRLRPDSCWGSTVGSRRYNRYFRGRCGPADEAMHRAVRGAYAQGLVVGYNTDPIVQGRGSAIFVHVLSGGATSGCVALPRADMIALVRVTGPGDAIVMGVRGVVTR